MTGSKRIAFAFTTSLLTGLAASSAFAADTTIKVSLWDQGGASAMMDATNPRVITHATEAATAMMGITLDQATVPAGNVTFAVSNDSKALLHEMLVIPLANMTTELPYIADENRVDEHAAGDLGEVADLDPGKSGSLGLDLAAGQYLLFCNIPGHYIGGMWTVLTVTP